MCDAAIEQISSLLLRLMLSLILSQASIELITCVYNVIENKVKLVRPVLIATCPHSKLRLFINTIIEISQLAIVPW